MDKHPNIGSNFEDWLNEEEFFEDVTIDYVKTKLNDVITDENIDNEHLIKVLISLISIITELLIKEPLNINGNKLLGQIEQIIEIYEDKYIPEPKDDGVDIKTLLKRMQYINNLNSECRIFEFNPDDIIYTDYIYDADLLKDD